MRNTLGLSFFICLSLLFFSCNGLASDDQSMHKTAAENAQARCSDPALIWRTGKKTNYTSYPEPGSEECIDYNGCFWEGQFTACEGKLEEQWVSVTDIAAVFPHFKELAHHELCIKSGDKVMIVNVIDSCGDADCDGCCTENKGSADALIDLESYTNTRWGLADSDIEWADLGERTEHVCK